MYIAAFPSLSPAHFLRRKTQEGLPFPLDCAGSTYFYAARNGIYHLMRSLGIQNGGTVLAPDYHHGNEIRAIRAAGAKIRYYPIRKNLEVDLDAVAELCKTGPRVLYITHFLGWPQPMREIKALCSDRGIILIEDCALSFMSEVDGKPLGTFGDYSVFCLYKTIPLPNGGVLVRNVNSSANLEDITLHECTRLSVLGQSTELMLLWLKSHCEVGGRLGESVKRTAGRMLSAAKVRRVPIGDTGFDVSNTSFAMSPICHTLLERFHYDSIKRNRRRNFEIMQQRLQGRARFPDKTLSEGMCPLFFPLLVAEKRLAAQLLRRRGIQTVEFWNNPAPELRNQKSDAGFLRRHLLEVPIHQDIEPEEVEFMARQIIDLEIGLAA